MKTKQPPHRGFLFFIYTYVECGSDLVTAAAGLAVTLSERMDIEETVSLIEFLGLLRHNLEIIKHRRIHCEHKQRRETEDRHEG